MKRCRLNAQVGGNGDPIPHMTGELIRQSDNSEEKDTR